jgi:cysteine-rich repeat protein
MKKSVFIGITISLCLVLLLSVVSAGWFSDLFKGRGVTGNVVNLDDGLVAHYAGSDFTDSSANGNNILNCEGHCPSLSDNGKIGDAAEFNGVEDYVQAPDVAGFEFAENSGFALVAWVNSDSSKVTQALFNKRYRYTDINSQYYATISNNVGTIAFGTYDGSYHTVRANFSADTWQHVVLLRKVNGNMEVYINGVLSGFGESTTADLGVTDLSLTIGMDARNSGLARYDNNYFKGMIDEVRVYNKELSQEEITALYELAGSGTTPEASCVDYDDGLDYYEKGESYSSIQDFTQYDECDSSYVIENFCEGEISLEELPREEGNNPYLVGTMGRFCPNGCSNGACNEVTAGNCEEIKIRARNFFFNGVEEKIDIDFFSLDQGWREVCGAQRVGDICSEGNIEIEILNIINEGSVKKALFNVLNDGMFYNQFGTTRGNIIEFDHTNDFPVIAKWCDGSSIPQTNNTNVSCDTSIYFVVADDASQSEMVFVETLRLHVTNNSSGLGPDCSPPYVILRDSELSAFNHENLIFVAGQDDRVIISYGDDLPQVALARSALISQVIQSELGDDFRVNVYRNSDLEYSLIYDLFDMPSTNGSSGGQGGSGYATGCVYNNQSYPIGNRFEAEGIDSYCEVGKEIMSQVATGTSCQNNYECKSNDCSNGVCIDLVEEIGATKAFFVRILCRMSNLFAPAESYAQCINEYLGFEEGYCGDGIVEGGEGCDDQNNVNGDGCENNCFVTCSDDDVSEDYKDGKDFYTTGTTEGIPTFLPNEDIMTITDSCQNSFHLREYFCTAQGMEITSYYCDDEGKFCMDGRCVNEDEIPNCYERDGGINYIEPSEVSIYVSGTMSSFLDDCIGGTMLQEYSCPTTIDLVNQVPQLEVYDCTEGGANSYCRTGRCYYHD